MAGFCVALVPVMRSDLDSGRMVFGILVATRRDVIPQPCIRYPKEHCDDRDRSCVFMLRESSSSAFVHTYFKTICLLALAIVSLQCFSSSPKSHSRQSLAGHRVDAASGKGE